MGKVFFYPAAHEVRRRIEKGMVGASSCQG
jgi:hypothetical protein